MSLFNALADKMTQTAWVAVLFYYAIKLFAQFVILYNMTSTRGRTNPLFQQLGADLSFMGLTLFGRALSDSTSTIWKQSSSPYVLLFLLSIYFLLSFATTYYLFRKQSQLNDREHRLINLFRGTYEGESYILVSRYCLIGTSWVVGVISFLLSANLFTNTP
jgi:hypothetical protein